MLQNFLFQLQSTLIFNLFVVSFVIMMTTAMFVAREKGIFCREIFIALLAGVIIGTYQLVAPYAGWVVYQAQYDDLIFITVVFPAILTIVAELLTDGGCLLLGDHN